MGVLCHKMHDPSRIRESHVENTVPSNCRVKKVPYFLLGVTSEWYVSNKHMKFPAAH